ncbi:MAG: NAD-dependent epimerase/dehydratase family protein, partial [Gammaproteobacteria bacterium]
MAVLVTGATGFLGSRVVDRLVKRGHRVVATGRDRDRARMLDAPFRRAELSRIDEVAGLCDGIDVVVHCAGLSSAWAPYRAFHAANVRATTNLLREAKRSGVRRFVHISTSSVYARACNQYALPEQSTLPRRPANDYVATKLAAERAERAVRRAALPYVILRPRGIFGPQDTSIFPRLLRALSKGRLPVIGNGQSICDLTYIDNAAEAVCCAVEAPGAAVRTTYNVTNGEPVQVWEVIGELAAALGLEETKGRGATS